MTFKIYTALLCLHISFFPFVSGHQVLNKDSGELSSTIGQQELAEFLQFFVSSLAADFGGQTIEGDWGIDYKKLSESDFFKRNIEYLRKAARGLQLSDLQMDEPEKKSLFINFYNLMILDVLMSLPKLPESIDLPSKFERKFAYQFQDFELSIGAIKHGVLRGNQPDPYDGHVYLTQDKQDSISLEKDPRILGALFLTTSSRIALRGFTSQNMERELEYALASLCEVGVQTEDSNLLLSTVFKDYLEDFGSSETDVLKWLSTCVKGMNKRILLYFASKQKAYLSYTYVPPNRNLTSWEIEDKNKLSVDIYTESMCVDSKEFFVKQFSKDWPRLKDLMKLRIIPFGKASVTTFNNGSDLKFDCQNGPEECQGNKVMSCVVALLPERIHVSFLTCLHTSNNVPDFKMCASELGVPPGPIEECLLTNESVELLYDNGEKTLKLQPQIYFVPTVAINNVYNSKEIERSTKRFGEHFCDVYRQVFSKSNGIATPPGCKTKIEVFLESMNQDVQRFFLNQLSPTWERLDGAVDLNIIAFGNATWSSSNPDAISCPHGPLECYGNIVIGCIVYHLKIEDQMKILRCMFTKRLPPLKGQECAKQEGIPWRPIVDCAEGTLGPQLLKENAERTSSLVPPLSLVPTIVINGVHNETFKDWALNDLLALVCDTYYMARRNQAKANLPPGCPVRVEVYLESLCPDTTNFLLRQLHPTWKKLSPIIDLHFVPFGKANVWRVPEIHNFEFECQNGPLECRGNKVMSCAVEFLPVGLQVEFIACMLRDKSPSSSGEKCAKELKVSWEHISNCSSSPEGSHLLFQNGVRTMALRPTLFFVPTITINGYYDKSQLQISLQDLENQICETYLGTLSRDKMILTPKGCRAKLEIFLESDSKDSRNFVVDELVPTWKTYNRMLTLKILLTGGTSNQNSAGHNSATANKDPFTLRKIGQCNLGKAIMCASSMVDDSAIVEFLRCAYNQVPASCLHYQKCSENLGMPWAKILSCAQGTKGAELSDNAERILDAIPFQNMTERFPFVAINEFAISSSNGTSKTSLENSICTAYYDPESSTSKLWRPGGCPIKVEVYLSALCPDFKKFYQRELQQAWKRLKDIMDLRLIPFGKAAASFNLTSQEYQFECQNGPAECHGNRLLSCMTQHYSIDQQIDLISCMYHVQISTSQGQKCSEQLGLDWQVISTCMTEESGSLLFENGQKTNQLRPSLFFVPTVTINKHYNRIQLRSTLKDLSGFLCNVYLNTDDGFSGGIPEGCKVRVSVFFSTLGENMKDFFAFHAEEFWKHFKKVVALTFLPLPEDDSQKPSTGDVTTNITDCSSSANQSCPGYHSRFLSCLASLYNTDIQMEIMACLMSQNDSQTNYGECLKEFKLSQQEMSTCVASQKSQDVLDKNLSKYSEVKHLYAKQPLVIVEKIIIRDYSQLLEVACKKYQGPKPAKCHQNEGS